MAVIIREIAYGTKFYEDGKILREKILRTPLGLKQGEYDLNGEDKHIHLYALDDKETVAGTVILKIISEKNIRLRQMAIDTPFQRQGLGTKLVGHAETLARARGFEFMDMLARIPAKNFYKKLGYEINGEEFVEIGIPVVMMGKKLT